MTEDVSSDERSGPEPAPNSEPGGGPERPANSGSGGEPEPRAPDEVVDPEETVDFEDLSLPQRVFVAAVQNPSRGVFVVGLFAFGFSFYVAFWMVFPRVAAFLTAGTLLLAFLALAVYYLVRRLR